MRGHDPQNTAHSVHFGCKKGAFGNYLLSDGRGATGLPSVGPDGTVYMVAGRQVQSLPISFLLAMDPGGSIRWATLLLDSQGRNTGGANWPAIGANGCIYLGWCVRYSGGSENWPHVLIAFDRDGNVLWRFEPNIPYQYGPSQSPVLGPDGTIYIGLDVLATVGGTQRPCVFAIDAATGTEKWRFVVSRQGFGGGVPVLGRDGRLFVHTAGYPDFGSVYCLDSVTGAQLWELYPAGNGRLPASVDGDGNVYVHNLDAEQWTAKLDADGNLLWRYRPYPYWVNGSPAIADGRIYLPLSYNGAGAVDALDLNSGQRVLHLADAGIIYSVAIDHAGNIYRAGDHRLAAYSRGGQPLWDLPLPQVRDVIIGGDGWLVASNSSISAMFESAVTLGDLNCDGSLNQFDIDPFIAALGDLERYRAAYPACDYETAGDFNLNGTVNAFDIQGFIATLTP